MCNSVDIDYILGPWTEKFEERKMSIGNKREAIVEAPSLEMVQTSLTLLGMEVTHVVGILRIMRVVGILSSCKYDKTPNPINMIMGDS